MKYSLGIFQIFLKRSLIFPILLFSSISLHWSLRKTFLSLLVILWNSAFKWVYLSFSPLPFASLLFTAICKASSDNHFAFLHFFSWGIWAQGWVNATLLRILKKCAKMSCYNGKNSTNNPFLLQFLLRLSFREKTGRQIIKGRMWAMSPGFLNWKEQCFIFKNFLKTKQ